MSISRKSSIIIAGVLLFAAGATAFADRAFNQDEVTSRLSPVPGVITGADGSAFRLAERHRSLIGRDRFSAMISLPLPSVTPPIADAKSTDNGTVKAVLSRGLAPYAECTLSLHELETETKGAESRHIARYAVDLSVWQDRDDNKQLSTDSRIRAGSCDVDLQAEGIQSGVPNVKKKDTISLEYVKSDGTRSPFLAGTF